MYDEIDVTLIRKLKEQNEFMANSELKIVRINLKDYVDRTILS